MIPLLALAITVGCFSLSNHFDRAVSVLPQRCPNDDQEMEVYKGLGDFLMAAGKVAAAFVVGEAIGSAGESAGLSSAGASGSRAGDALFQDDGKRFDAFRNWKCKTCGHTIKAPPLLIIDPTDKVLKDVFFWSAMIMNFVFLYSLFRWFFSPS